LASSGSGGLKRIEVSSSAESFPRNKEGDSMERRACFGSLQEITDQNGFTKTESRPECRDCQEIRDCLRYSKEAAEARREKDELRKQNIITQIIDLSQINSNELGSCLLEFLDRTYSSPIGVVLFKNLFLFLEVSQQKLSSTVTVPISTSTLDLIREAVKGGDPAGQKETDSEREDVAFALRIILIQGYFPNNRKANMGLIAYEFANFFSSDNQGISQILQVLTASEIYQFKKMDARQRIYWLMEKWRFKEEFEAFRQEVEKKKN
jgi:hypothetical protein